MESATVVQWQTQPMMLRLFIFRQYGSMVGRRISPGRQHVVTGMSVGKSISHSISRYFSPFV